MSYQGDNQSRGQRRGPRPDREMHDTVCSDCQTETQVPFKPDGDRPVYCRDCYTKNRPPKRSRY